MDGMRGMCKVSKMTRANIPLLQCLQEDAVHMRIYNYAESITQRQYAYVIAESYILHVARPTYSTMHANI
jgi:hypothetical protein